MSASPRLTPNGMLVRAASTVPLLSASVISDEPIDIGEAPSDFSAFAALPLGAQEKPLAETRKPLDPDHANNHADV